MNKYEGALEGVDGEELFSEVMQRFARRAQLKLVRAVLQNDVQAIRQAVNDDGAEINEGILPLAAYEEVAKVNEMDYDVLAQHPALADQAEPYSQPPQFQSGESGTPNECFPTGEYDAPMRDVAYCFATPLMWAAHVFARPETVAVLLELGADRDVQLPNGLTVIMAMLECNEGNDISSGSPVDLLRQLATPRNLQMPTSILERVLTSEDWTLDDGLASLLVELDVPISRGFADAVAEDSSWMSPVVVPVVARARVDENLPPYEG